MGINSLKRPVQHARPESDCREKTIDYCRGVDMQSSCLQRGGCALHLRYASASKSRSGPPVPGAGVRIMGLPRVGANPCRFHVAQTEVTA